MLQLIVCNYQCDNIKVIQLYGQVMINIQKYILTASVLALSGGGFFINAAQAETLQEALINALQYHPSVDAAHAARQNLKDQEVEEWAGQFPEINVTATAGRVYGDNATSRGLSVTRGSGYSYLWEGSAGITQKIFDGFETGARIDAAEDRYRSANLDIIDVRENLALQTAKSYLDVMRTNEILAIVKKHNAQVADYRGRISMMTDEGVADQSELKLSEDITILLDNIFEDYYAQYMTAQATYMQLTGDRPTGHMMLPEWDNTSMPNSLDEGITTLAAHPSIQSVDYRAQADEHEIDATKAGFYPDVNGELSYLKKDLDDLIGGEVDDARAVVKMNWNFSVGGAQFARVRQKQAQKYETEAQKRELKRQLTQNLEQAWIEYETSERVLDNMSRRRAINEELFNTNAAQFEGAQIRLLQLMQSENQYFQTRIEYINSKYRHHLSKMAVLASLGYLQKAMGVEVEDAEYVYKAPFRFDD